MWHFYESSSILLLDFRQNIDFECFSFLFVCVWMDKRYQRNVQKSKKWLENDSKCYNTHTHMTINFDGLHVKWMLIFDAIFKTSHIQGIYFIHNWWNQWQLICQHLNTVNLWLPLHTTFFSRHTISECVATSNGLKMRILQLFATQH